MGASPFFPKDRYSAIVLPATSTTRLVHGI